MNVLRHRYSLVCLVLVAMTAIAGCTSLPPASPSGATAPASTSVVQPSPASTEPPSAAATSDATDSPLPTPSEAATAVGPGTSTTPTVEATAAATTAATAAAIDDATTGRGAGADINEVTFTATEYQFDAPDTLEAGWTRFILDNQGQMPHDLTLLKPEAGKTVTDVLNALQSEGPPDWVQLYGGVAAGPGETGVYTVNLDAGNYIALSFGESESGPPDAAQGMIHSFTVTGQSADLPDDLLPEANATVDMIDFAFVITGTLGTGEQTIRVMNTGKALHEMQVFHLNEGVTFEQFRTMLDQEPTPGQEPPFTYVGGPVMSPGVEGFVKMNLEAGTHVLVCFIPAPEHGGQPHYQLGMIRAVEVE